MDTHEIIELLDKTLLTHPHVVDFEGRGSAGKTPDDIPGVSLWLDQNVSVEDWEYVTYFGTMTFYFADKAKAALFKTFFK